MTLIERDPAPREQRVWLDCGHSQTSDGTTIVECWSCGEFSAVVAVIPS